MINVIKTLKDKRSTKRQQTAEMDAEDYITITDFCNKLFIAHNGVPLIPIQDEWTPKVIIEELTKVRQNYINAKLQQRC